MLHFAIVSHLFQVAYCWQRHTDHHAKCIDHAESLEHNVLFVSGSYELQK